MCPATARRLRVQRPSEANAARPFETDFDSRRQCPRPPAAALDHYRGALNPTAFVAVAYVVDSRIGSFVGQWVHSQLPTRAPTSSMHE